MANIVILYLALDTLSNLFSVRDYESTVIVNVKNDIVRFRKLLMQIMVDADAITNITDDIANRFKEIIRICYKLEICIESCPPEIASKKSSLKMIFRRRSRIKDIEKLSKELADKISIQLPPNIWSTPVNQSPETVEEIIDSVNAEMNKLMGVLICGTSQPHVVSVLGPAGIGKTYVTRLLFNVPLIERHFNVRVLVHVSRQFDRRRVLKEILAGASLQLSTRPRAIDGMSEGDLAELIEENLVGRRYLIVLDDVWSNDVWLGLEVAFPKDNIGSKVIITSRKTHVSNLMPGHMHIIQPLSDQESQKQFKRKIGLREADINDKSDFELICGKIGMLSGGIPRVVNAIADLLSQTPLENWKDRKSDIIGLSYKHLPHPLRPCLLYFVNFPRDIAMDWDTICQLWIAEELISIENRRNGERMMDVAARHLDELANRRLLIIEEEVAIQSRFKCSRIDDFLHKFCESNGETDEFLEVICLGNENQNTSLSIRCSIHADNYEGDYSHLDRNADNLRTLFFFASNQSEEIIGPLEIPNLDKFVYLRVLFFYGVDFVDGKLPKGLDKLVYLKYLSFRECYLKEFSSLVGKKLCLQTLDLRVRDDCKMIITDVFCGFKRLKYMYFPEDYRALNHGKLHLGELNELEIIDNFDATVCNVEDLHMLTDLKELSVITGVNTESTIGKDTLEIETILNVLEKCNINYRSISMKIRNFDCYSIKRLSTMRKVFNSSVLNILEVVGHLEKLTVLEGTSSKLSEVTLNGSELVEDPMPILQKFPNLTILVLTKDACTVEFMKCSSSGFLKIKSLKLQMLAKLKSLEVEEGAMPSLLILVFENCENLQMLPEGLKFCKKLQKLEINSMPDAFVEKIKKLDGTEGEDFYKIEHVLPNVKIDGQPLVLRERERQQEQPQGEEEVGRSIDSNDRDETYDPYYNEEQPQGEEEVGRSIDSNDRDETYDPYCNEGGHYSLAEVYVT